MVKISKHFQIYFLIAQIRRFGTLKAMQKTAALYKAPLLKNQEKLPEISQFYQKKCMFDYFQAVFPDLFKNGAVQRAAVFLRCIQFPKTLSLSYQKQHSVIYIIYFNLFLFQGGPLPSKSTGSRKKGKKKKKKRQFYILQQKALRMRGFQNCYDGKASYEGN